MCVNASGPRYIRRRLNAYYVSYVFPVHGCRAERKFLCDRNVTSVGHQTAHRLHYIAIETRGCVLSQRFPNCRFRGRLGGVFGGKIRANRASTLHEFFFDMLLDLFIECADSILWEYLYYLNVGRFQKSSFIFVCFEQFLFDFFRYFLNHWYAILMQFIENFCMIELINYHHMFEEHCGCSYLFVEVSFLWHLVALLSG